jgi:Ni,Fe-hydrogenase III large subunit
MKYQIPMGPYHPALEEPYRLDMVCERETVKDASLRIGFNFRGIEQLAETRNYVQVIALMERVCGICSNIHTLSICQAMENLTGIQPPPRANYIRVIMAELERLHSHVLWAGIAGKVMGFKTMFMTCFALREQIMDVLETISGNRVNYSMNRLGGVNRDIADPDEIRGMVKAIEKEMLRVVIPVFTSNRAVGPVARASGLTQDLRRDASYAAYGEMEFDVPVQAGGDVKARLIVRALEIIESCKILYQALDKLPAGELFTEVEDLEFPSGRAVSRVEAPRGEVIYCIGWEEENEIPSRVHVRTPTYANMPAIRYMVQGARLADVPLIQASIDPCYSCTDR